MNRAILVAVIVVAIAVTAGILISFSGDDQFITVDVPKNMVAGERYSATITLPEEFFEKYRTVKLHFTNNEYRSNFATLPEGVNKGSFKIVPQAEGPFSVKAVYGKMSNNAVSDVDAAPPKPVPNIQIWVPDRIHIWKNYHGTITMKEPSTTDRTVLLSGSGGINLHQTHIMALFNYGDLACLLFESELFRSCPESCGTGCSKVSSQQGCYCSELWIGA